VNINILDTNTPFRKAIFKNGRILLVIFTLIFSFCGKAVYADDDQELDDMEFQSTSDYNLLIGEATNIKVILFDDDEELFSESGLSAYVTDPDGEVVDYYSISGSGGYYTVSDVTLDYEGEYGLYIRDDEWNYASGKITVTKPLLSISGELAENRKTEITGKLTKADGKALARKTVTVDGTDVGLDSSESYTTSFDGTFSFWITPTEQGELKFLYSGHEIVALEVGPSYSHGDRIGGEAKSNVELSIRVAQQGWTSAENVILTGMTIWRMP
jgi:hypothetical protein